MSQYLLSPGSSSVLSNDTMAINNEMVTIFDDPTRAALARQAAHVIASLAAINCSFTTSAWSIVCPNWSSSIHDLEDIVASSQCDLRTVDYIFPATQSTPNLYPRIWMINLLTRDPQVNHDFQLTQILFTDAGMATESKIEFEGVGILQYADYKDGSCPTWVLSGKCEAVAGTGTGIFADAFGGRTIFTSPWSHQLPQQEGIAEWCRSGLRICPATWTFLFEKQISDSLQYAILKETL